MLWFEGKSPLLEHSELTDAERAFLVFESFSHMPKDELAGSPPEELRKKYSLTLSLWGVTCPHRGRDWLGENRFYCHDCEMHCIVPRHGDVASAAG